MADIGTLVVRMAADSAKMRSDLERVQRDLRSTGSVADKLGGQFKMLGGVVAGISLTALATQAIQLAGALNDTSIRTGIATDALQRLQFAAGLSGSSLEAVSGAVARMQKALTGADEGGKEAVAALDRLGLSAKQIIALAPDKQFEAIAEKIAGIQNPAERTTAAMALFGRSGAELLPLLDNLGKNADQFNQQLQNIGGPVGVKAINTVDQLGDQFDVLKTGVNSLVTEIVALFGPPVIAGLELLATTLGVVRIGLLGSGEEAVKLGQKIDQLRGRALLFKNDQSDSGQQRFRELTAEIKALEEREAKLLGLASQWSALEGARPPNLGAPKIDVAALSAPNLPGLGGGGGAGGKPEMTAAERRAASDKSYLMTLNLQALEAYQLQEFNLTDHLARVEMMKGEHSARLLEQSRWQYSAEGQLLQMFGVEYDQLQTDRFERDLTLRESLFSAGTSIMGALFASDKKFAIAQALVSTYAGAARAYKDVPFPANIAAVATIIAGGMKQVAAIKKTNPGSGATSAGGAGISAGMGGTSALPDNAPAFAQQEPQRIAQVVVQGNLFSARETADWLIEQLSDAVNNRDVVFINGASRQAGAIAGAA